MSNTPLKRIRPQSMRAKRLELKQPLLEHPEVPKVIEAVNWAASDDNHKNQTSAQKILTNGMLRLNAFEKAIDSRKG